MLLSRKWLDEFVHVDANDKEFAEAMTLSGSKVETTEDRGAEISNIVVGTILTMERHPDSDHMWICQLDVGQSAPIQIVTGAWNIHPGDMVPVALDHSTLPGGKKIEKGKLRGVVSNGMMCGLSELGLDERDFPYAAIIPAAATSAALIYVGILMLQGLKRVDFDDMDQMVPVALMLIGMPISGSIGHAIGLGLISYTIMKIFGGKAKEVSVLTYVISALFLVKFFLAV